MIGPMKTDLSIDNALADVEETVPPEAKAYFEYHRRRYAMLAGLVRDLSNKLSEDRPARVTIIGPGYEVPIIDLVANVEITTVGLGETTTVNGRTHVQFDLRWLLDGTRVPDLAPADILLLCEVIEHLPYPPEIALSAFIPTVRAGGAFVVQTPNAARLDARMKLLLGKNPFELLRSSLDNPGHYREYTVADVGSMAAATNLSVELVACHNYLNGGGRHPRVHKAYVRFESVVPTTLREGITAVLRTPLAL